MQQAAEHNAMRQPHANSSRSALPTRRRFLRWLTGCMVGAAAYSDWWLRRALARHSRHLTVVNVDRVTLKVPFRPVPARAMAREIPHWQYTELCFVKLASGVTGLGETLLFYTWGVPSEAAVRRVLGKNAAEYLWDRSLGAGLQMALFDAVARTLEVPVHRLLGRQVHRETPLSWWNIDMPPEDMVAECKEAYRSGYLAYKTKGRPWFDVWAQVEQIARALPAEFKVDLDFNDTLLDADRAIPILKELEQYPQVGIYETPIPQGDVAGNKRIKAAVRTPIAMHYGNPAPLVALREDVCDGFVVSGSAAQVLAAGHVAAIADKPFWLQLVGTGVTAAFSLHFGAVLSHATWPAVNCHQLYVHQLLDRPIPVRRGMAPVPDGPGLGYTLDPSVIDRFRVPRPPRRPEPPRLIEVSWPDGRRMYIANTGAVNFMLTLAQRGKMPYFERGVTTRLVPDDGTEHWREVYRRARKEPFLTRSSLF